MRARTATTASETSTETTSTSDNCGNRLTSSPGHSHKAARRADRPTLLTRRSPPTKILPEPRSGVPRHPLWERAPHQPVPTEQPPVARTRWPGTAALLPAGTADPTARPALRSSVGWAVLRSEEGGERKEHLGGPPTEGRRAPEGRRRVRSRHSSQGGTPGRLPSTGRLARGATQYHSATCSAIENSAPHSPHLPPPNR